MGPSHSGPGPAQAPKNSSAPRNEAPITWRVLAELNQRELHARVLDAEAGHELGFGFEDVERRAILGGDRRHDEGDECELPDDRVEDEPEAALRGRNVRQPQRSGEQHRRQRGKDERQVVGDHLVDRAHGGQQRVLVVRAPSPP